MAVNTWTTAVLPSVLVPKGAPYLSLTYWVAWMCDGQVAGRHSNRSVKWSCESCSQEAERERERGDCLVQFAFLSSTGLHGMEGCHPQLDGSSQLS